MDAGVDSFFYLRTDMFYLNVKLNHIGISCFSRDASLPFSLQQVVLYCTVDDIWRLHYCSSTYLVRTNSSTIDVRATTGVTFVLFVYALHSSYLETIFETVTAGK